MNRPKSVQLELSLFIDLYVYAVRHAEVDDLQYERIRTGVRQKINAMMRHDLYSLYKVGASPEVRKKARKEYLDAIGLFDEFRWDDDQDMNINH